MLQCIFLLSDSGEVMLEKQLTGHRVDRSICDWFWEQTVSQADSTKLPPVIASPTHYIFQITREGITFLACTQVEMPPLMGIEFLCRVADVLSDYLGGLNEDVIKDNFVIVYELLDEMIDNGFPLTTEPNILREMIALPNIVSKVLGVVTGNSSNVSNTLPGATASCVPWRSTEPKHANNEVYVDLLEEMDAVINRDGILVKCEIYGEVEVNSHLSGLPDLTLSFANPSILNDVRFHPCVRFRPWESNNILSFVPPDGQFKLMSYRVKKLRSTPIYVKPQLTSDAGTCRLSVLVGIRSDPGKTIDSVTVQFQLPPCILSANLSSNHGTVSILANKTCSWSIGRIPKDKAPSLSGTLTLETGMERLHVFPTFQVGFRIMGVALSGLQIDTLDIKNLPSRPYKGFRALTQAGQYESWEKTVDCYSPGQGLMPASFKVRTVPLDGNNEAHEEVLDPDFGESAIGRVAPVDSGLWWIILLRAYGKITGDYTLQERVDVQTGIKLILNLCLTDGFDMFPSLLVTDGSCMIDRRMGIHGHPLEIQALFYSALRCSREMLTQNDASINLVRAINNRLSALSFHIREYYWVDMKKINEIYRYKTEEYSTDATNKFNIYPDQIPSWLMDWVPEEGGYLIGNLQPAHMDFRFFTLGNLWSIISSLGTPKQNQGILDTIQAKWDDLVGHMPLKICYPALEYEEWRIITGSDPKNTPWSYHNGGSWPTLLWQFTLACIKMGRPELARKAVADAEKRLAVDRWPEYYDTRNGRFIGKQSRLFQTWTIAGYLTSKMLLENPEMAALLFWEEDYDLLEICVCGLSKTGRRKCSRFAARSQILV